MKLNIKKLLLGVAPLALAVPLFLATDAGAYLGDQVCAGCHNNAPTATSDHASQYYTYKLTGHKNTSALASTSPVGPSGAALDVTGKALVHHAWFEGDGFHSVAAATPTATSSFDCAPCHTTGYSATENQKYTAAEIGVTYVGSNGYNLAFPTKATGGSFALFGVQCEKCHGERGNVDISDCTDAPVSLSYKWRIRTPGAGDDCSSSGRVTSYFCSDEQSFPFTAGVTLKEPTTGADYTYPAADCGDPSAQDGHHDQFNPDADIAHVLTDDTKSEKEKVHAVYALCGECHMSTHHSVNFLNSPHSSYTGTWVAGTSLAALSDNATYGDATHFEDGYNGYGAERPAYGCTVCHNVHVTTFETTPAAEGSAWHFRCGMDCHGGSGNSGFHDGMENPLAPSTISTEDHCKRYPFDTTEEECTTDGGTWYAAGEVGRNFEGCKACHFPKGSHLLMNQTADNSDGVNPLMSGSSGVCTQCHNGSALFAFDNETAVAQAVMENGGYHDLDLAGFHARATLNGANQCSTCHAEKAESFAKTGHHNMQRVTDGSATGGVTNPAGNAYPVDLTGVVMIYDGWLGYNTSGEALTPRTATAGGTYTCGACHSTGYATDKSKAEPAATIGTAADNFTGSWDQFGVQCQRCHQNPTTGEVSITGGTGSSTVDAASGAVVGDGSILGLCRECHTGSHNELFSEGAHGNPEGHFNAEEACVACHNVHGSVVEVTATEGFNAKCGIDCHNPESTHTPDGGMQGFHDGLPGIAPNTEEGTNFEACVTCHMKGSGNHLFRINTDPSYTYELDAADSADAAICVAQGGHVAASHGVDTCLDASGAHMGRQDADGEVWVDLTQACGQCHDGSKVFAFTLQEMAVYANDYHGAGSSFDINAQGNSTTSAAGARINWYKGAGCNTVQVDGSMNNADGTGCTWSVSDAIEGSVPETCSGEIEFSKAGAHEVTLTMDNGATRTVMVTASGNSSVPEAAFEVKTDIDTTGDQSGMRAQVKDLSQSLACGNMDDDAGTGTILWGDGTVSQIDSGATSPAHQYSAAGTYRISYTFRDASNGKKGVARAQTVVLPDVATALFNIKGTITKAVGGAPVGNVNVNLYKNDGTIFVRNVATSNKDDATKGTYAFYNVPALPGGASYTIVPVKNGYVFDDPNTAANPVGADRDVIVNFTADEDPTW